MKILALLSAIAFLLLAGTAFAAFIFWGHPYTATVNHLSENNGTVDNSQSFGGCPYLQELHEGVEPYGGESVTPDLEGKDGFRPGQGQPLPPESTKSRQVLYI